MPAVKPVHLLCIVSRATGSPGQVFGVKLQLADLGKQAKLVTAGFLWGSGYLQGLKICSTTKHWCTTVDQA